MKRHDQILLENKAWASEKVSSDPAFFTRHAKRQKPDILWIGCSDSRVSPSEITQTNPGEIFIHRNVANLVVHTDLNLLSVMQYAVEVLEINHVIVCGHYNCGGVQAALGNKSFGIIDTWLRHIKDVYRLHQPHVDAASTEEDRVNRLVEWNIKEQLYNLAKTPLIQHCWQKYQRPYLHGWVYGMNDGIIKQILEIDPGSKLPDQIYEYERVDEVPLKAQAK